MENKVLSLVKIHTITFLAPSISVLLVKVNLYDYR